MIHRFRPRPGPYLPLFLALALVLTVALAFPAVTTPRRIEHGTVTHVADGDTVTIIIPKQTKLRVRMFGIDVPETPKGPKYPGQPYGR